MHKIALCLLLTALAAPVAAKDSLGVYSGWAAFRDPDTPRCYAIAKPRGRNSADAYATIATWPDRNIRNQVHFRLSRTVSDGTTMRLRIGTENFDLMARGRNAWALDTATDASIVAALRSASVMRVSGRGFSDRYNLDGVATAMDAAVVACANQG